MAFPPGKRFGAYEIVEQIGAGGMGEVYRATDTSLKRDVAIKVLPESFANDADRLARFQREAEILAALNHPNIAQIYGLEDAGGETVIVMELVEGPTLADRITEGPFTPDEALGIAYQIADALEAAHGRQIVHRDLKPQNIKLRPDGTVKILDFGIAKPVDLQSISGGLSPVMTTPAVTQTGVILGTAAYMSPEQARGKPVDQRTDIWAFGCLLFEMLTGQTAFGGEDVMLTLARVLDRDTDMSSMPGTVSPAVRHAIGLCLEKDPRKRIADIRDVRLALEGRFETQLPRDALAEAERGGRARLLIPAAVATGIVAAAAAWLLKPAPEPAPELITRFSQPLGDDVTLRLPVLSVLDVARNGEFFVFNGMDGIHLRSMDTEETRIIPGTNQNIGNPTLSPDGSEVVYFRAAETVEVVKIAVDGGAPIVLASGLDVPFGLSWEDDGTVLFGQPDGIWRVPENGGQARLIVETAEGEQADAPQLLPGGEWVLFTVTSAVGANRWNQADIVVQSLATGERRMLRSGAADARYLPSGHLVYVFENVLFASTFDVETLSLGDERVSLIQGVQTSTGAPLLGGRAFYAVADNGTLVYVPGFAGAAPENPEKGLVWVDRRGNTETVPIRRDNYTMARISPDGTKIAVVVGSEIPRTNPRADIYVFDLETENLTQLTFDPAGDDGPVWSADGSRIFFRSYRGEDPDVAAVWSIPAEGGTAELVATSERGVNPLPWSMSPDGETLVLVDAVSLQDADIASVALGAGDALAPLYDDDGIATEPTLSPDGAWLVTAESATPDGRQEINLRPYPNVRQQRRPVGDGRHPVFAADGSALFFFDGGGLSAVPLQHEPLRIGTPQMLFRGQYWYGVTGPAGEFGRAWDVDPVNDRFLMIEMPQFGVVGDPSQQETRIAVVLNWFAELEARVPATR